MFFFYRNSYQSSNINKIRNSIENFIYQFKILLDLKKQEKNESCAQQIDQPKKDESHFLKIEEEILEKNLFIKDTEIAYSITNNQKIDKNHYTETSKENITSNTKQPINEKKEYDKQEINENKDLNQTATQQPILTKNINEEIQKSTTLLKKEIIKEVKKNN